MNENPDATRRRLLRGAAGLGLAACSARALAADEISPPMLALSDYVAKAPDRALPAEVVERAKDHILDTFGAMVSGSNLAPGKAAIAFARAYGGPKTATVAGSDVACGVLEAALANGVLAHSDETDDSHAPSQSHPGSSVVPASLAMGEQMGIGGAVFLRSVVLGYDVGTRVTMAMGGGAFRATSHRSTHSIAGGFGSAASAACAARLTAQQARWMFDYAAQQSSGIASWERDLDHIEKGFVFAGMPARTGVTAALLVKSGWNGVDDVFSGADNFFQAYAPRADLGQLTAGLGQRFEIVRTDIKKWTVGSPIQAPLDALELILRQNKVDAAQVRKVTVRMAAQSAKTVNDREMPDVNLQHMIAVMLLDGTASFASAHDKARMSNPAVLAQKAKVALVEDAELAKALPARHAIVEVEMADGRRLSQKVEAVRGTAANPMTREEVVAKARDLMTPVLGAGKTQGLISAVLGLERMGDIRAFRPLLQRKA